MALFLSFDPGNIVRIGAFSLTDRESPRRHVLIKIPKIWQPVTDKHPHLEVTVSLIVRLKELSNNNNVGLVRREAHFFGKYFLFVSQCDDGINFSCMHGGINPKEDTDRHADNQR